MSYTKHILASSKNYKITKYVNNERKTNKCVISFGEIDSTLDDEGFGKKFVMSLGLDFIYVAQKRYTQYQYLTAEKFESIVKESIENMEVYTYGSSLGGYCAIYYGGIINANILAFSPRIPAHPVIDKLMGKRFKNKGFYHKEIFDAKKTKNRVCIFYDENNFIDNYYIKNFVQRTYPNGDFFHVKNAGHYTARALLISQELKNVATNFFFDKEIDFTLDEPKILDWHIQTAKRRLANGKLPSAQENLEVVLNSNTVPDNLVIKLLGNYNQTMVKLVKANKDGYDRKPIRQLKLTDKMMKKKLYQLILRAKSVCFVGDSLTDGIQNVGCGWFEPLVENFRSLKVDKFTLQNGSSEDFLKHVKKYSKFKSDVYILALGLTDIQNSNTVTSAKTYIKNITKIANALKTKKASSKIVIIAPWSVEVYIDDGKIKLQRYSKRHLGKFCAELKRFSDKKDYIYIDPNKKLEKLIKKYIKSSYDMNNISKVVNLYSQAVLESSPYR